VREWLISDDPHHGWVRQSWDGQNIDPRLPFEA
jgi:5-deoxy-glucuronate isomerase